MSQLVAANLCFISSLVVTVCLLLLATVAIATSYRPDKLDYLFLIKKVGLPSGAVPREVIHIHYELQFRGLCRVFLKGLPPRCEDISAHLKEPEMVLIVVQRP